MYNNIIHENGYTYVNSLQDGSIYYILVESREYKVKYTDEDGYKAYLYKGYDHKGNLEVYSSITLTPVHIINLSKLKNGFKT